MDNQKSERRQEAFVGVQNQLPQSYEDEQRLFATLKAPWNDGDLFPKSIESRRQHETSNLSIEVRRMIDQDFID
ncbi:hypothetical protein YDYSG_48680 [Paenibacillus tyrfis]|nr:hypothetical protein YDYSG_48680 [Paenibacillus tyrfis]